MHQPKHFPYCGLKVLILTRGVRARSNLFTLEVCSLLISPQHPPYLSVKVHKTTAQTRSVSSQLLLQSASDLLEQIKLHIADNTSLSADNAAACKAVFDEEMKILTQQMDKSVSGATEYVGRYLHTFDGLRAGFWECARRLFR